MRSQTEILEKVEQISKMLKSKDDLMYLQYRILVHKLTWTNAKEYIVEKDRTEEMKENWSSTSQLDKKYILKEIEEQIDKTCMELKAKDAVMVMGHCLILLTQIWLLGPTKDKILSHLWKMFGEKQIMAECFEPVVRLVCEDLQIDIEKYLIRYEDNKPSSLILPPGFEKGENNEG